MRCPSCGTENYQGEDVCVACGASLTTMDTPEDPGAFQGRLLGEHLDELDLAEPAVVGPDDSVATALARMQECGTDYVLVLTDGHLVGIFTERDAVLKLAEKRPSAFDVRDVMTPDPVVLRHDDSLAVAIHKMAVGGFRHIPVMEGERPLAVVAAPDIFTHVLAVLE
jgi:CBS domain-containing protein